MDAAQLTRDHVNLLRAVGSGRVFTTNGIVMRRVDGDLNLHRRCDRMIRAFTAAGWVQVRPDGTYELTDEGRVVLGGAR